MIQDSWRHSHPHPGSHPTVLPRSRSIVWLSRARLDFTLHPQLDLLRQPWWRLCIYKPYRGSWVRLLHFWVSLHAQEWTDELSGVESTCIHCLVLQLHTRDHSTALRVHLWRELRETHQDGSHQHVDQFIFQLMEDGKVHPHSVSLRGLTDSFAPAGKELNQYFQWRKPSKLCRETSPRALDRLRG